MAIRMLMHADMYVRMYVVSLVYLCTYILEDTYVHTYVQVRSTDKCIQILYACMHVRTYVQLYMSTG